jgi:predicted DCC family thiol-disulfide oxidoreductase YuxK
MHSPTETEETDIVTDPAEKHWLLWDGECGFCRRSAEWVRRRDSAAVFEIVPYQAAPSPPMTPELYSQCSRAVHVVTNRSQVLRAGRACLFIADQLGYDWIARPLLLPPFIWLVELGYKIAAANRPLLSRFFLRNLD